MGVVRTFLLALIVAGCVGQISTSGGGGSGTPGDGSIDASGHPVWADAATGSNGSNGCKNPVSPVATGHHNSGKDCLQSCHNHGFTVAGTLYTNATGNTAFSGATVTIVDAQNQTIDMVTDSLGNFTTSLAVTFPVKATASSCPSLTAMVADATTGHCNACHAGGTSSQIHLP